MQPFRQLITLFLALLFLHQGMQGQNLVPNPSFEDINSCAEFSQPCSPSAWFYLSRKFTAGYFPRYPSATGGRHLQMTAASRETIDRQYWETMLLCPLQAGERYSLTLKVATPANDKQLSTTKPNLRDLGLWFTKRFIFVQGDSLLQPRSFLSLTDASVKDLKNGWFELKKEFTASADNSIMILGNFARAANIDIIEQRNPITPSIDMLADDISIVRTNGAETCPTYKRTKDSLYAITWRHSEYYPNNWVPADSDIVQPPKKIDPPHPSHPPVDTGSTFPPPMKTDTIIIRDILFDFDKFLIQNPDTLQRYRGLLTRPGIKKIQVVGFTDDAGSGAYNIELSQKRAREIARYIISKFNVSPGVLQPEGRGISRKYPTKYLNRRVEIYIFHE